MTGTNKGNCYPITCSNKSLSTKSIGINTMKDKELKELVKTATEKINDYHQHSLGKLNFWLTTPSYDNNYIICIENAQNHSNAITTKDILQLDADKYSYDDFLDIIDELHKLFPDIPFLFHELPKLKLNQLRDKYGSYYVRDDIVISEN